MVPFAALRCSSFARKSYADQPPGRGRTAAAPCDLLRGLQYWSLPCRTRSLWMELRMPRLPGARLAAASLLAATALSCSDTSAPSDANRASPTTAPLAQSATKQGPTLTPQASGTTAQLIGVHAVNQNVAWVSGVGGVAGTWASSDLPDSGCATLQLSR